MSDAFISAISARDCRDFHLITPRMNEADCVDALAYLERVFPRRRSQIRSIRARLNAIRMQPDMSRAAGEMNKETK